MNRALDVLFMEDAETSVGNAGVWRVILHVKKCHTQAMASIAGYFTLGQRLATQPVDPPGSTWMSTQEAHAYPSRWVQPTPPGALVTKECQPNRMSAVTRLKK